MCTANADLLKMNPHLTMTFFFWCYIIFASYSFSLFAQGAASGKNDKRIFVLYNSSQSESSKFLTPLVDELRQSINSYQITSIDLNKQPLKKQSCLAKASANSCIITIGYETLKETVSVRNKTPIFSTLVPKYALDSMIRNYQRLGSVIGGIYQEQSFNRQLLVAKAIDPEIKRVLVLLNRITRYQLSEYKDTASINAIKLKYNLLTAQVSASTYFEKNSSAIDALVVINEPQHHDNQDLQSLLITSYNKRVPIIGNKKTDSTYAAMVSIYTPLDILTKEVSAQILEFCETSGKREPKFAQSYSIELNKQIIDYLNYKNINKQDLLMDIHQLEKQQREMLNNG